MQPYFDITRKTTSKKKGRQPQTKKNGSQPPKNGKMEDDLKKKNGRLPKKSTLIGCDITVNS
jgi:hypothetical protein